MPVIYTQNYLLNITYASHFALFIQMFFNFYRLNWTFAKANNLRTFLHAVLHEPKTSEQQEKVSAIGERRKD